MFDYMLKACLELVALPCITCVLGNDLHFFVHFIQEDECFILLAFWNVVLALVSLIPLYITLIHPSPSVSRCHWPWIQGWGHHRVASKHRFQLCGYRAFYSFITLFLECVVKEFWPFLSQWKICFYDYIWNGIFVVF